MFLLVNNFKLIYRNAIEHFARSGPKRLTKTYNKGFPNHSTLINFAQSMKWKIDINKMNVHDDVLQVCLFTNF